MNIKIEVAKRELGKKSLLTEMRASGFIPGVIYGPQMESVPIKLEKGTFLKQYRKTIGELAIFVMELDGTKYQTIIKDKQIHPVTREFEHIDFYEISKASKLTVNIPVKYIGNPVGIKNGGELEVLIRELEAKCLPKDIVEDIELDISALEIGKSMTIEDIKIDTLEFSLPSDVALVIVHSPKSAEEETVDETGVDLESDETE